MKSQSILASIRGLKEFGYHIEAKSEKNGMVRIGNKLFNEKEASDGLHSLLLAERSRRAAQAQIKWGRNTLGISPTNVAPIHSKCLM